MTATSDLRQILEELRDAKRYATRQAARGRSHAHLLDAGGMMAGAALLQASLWFLAPVLEALPFWEPGTRGTALAKVFAFMLAAFLLVGATQFYVQRVRHRYGPRLPPPWGTGFKHPAEVRLRTLGPVVALTWIGVLVAGFWLAFQTPLRGALGAALVATGGLLSFYAAARVGDRVGVYQYALVVLAAPALVFLPYGILTSIAVSFFVLGLFELVFAAVRSAMAPREAVA